jgi:hypothetical protein
MKKVNRLIAGWALLLILAVACAPKQEAATETATETATEEQADWAELDSFHLFMADMFHPYKDSANLAPIKASAEQFAADAEKWAAAQLPEKVNNEAVKAMLEKLKTDTRALADQIKAGATDEEIGNSLNAVHDHFHKIQEAWYGGHGEHHEH